MNLNAKTLAMRLLLMALAVALFAVAGCAKPARQSVEMGAEPVD